MRLREETRMRLDRRVKSITVLVNLTHEVFMLSPLVRKGYHPIKNEGWRYLGPARYHSPQYLE